MKWLELWRNRDLAFRLWSWFKEIVHEARDAADALRRLTQSVHAGDLDDLVHKTQAVAKRRRDFVEKG